MSQRYKTARKLRTAKKGTRGVTRASDPEALKKIALKSDLPTVALVTLELLA